MKDIFKDKKTILCVLLIGIVLVGGVVYKNLNTNKNLNPNIKLSDYKHIDLSNVSEDTDVQDVILLDLLEKSEVPAPSEEEIKEYVDALDSYYNSYAESMGIDKETFMKEYVGIDNFDEIARENAIQYINSKAILNEISIKENIPFTDEDYDKYLESLIDGTTFDSVEAYKEYIDGVGETEDMKEAALFYKVLTYLEEENTK